METDRKRLIGRLHKLIGEQVDPVAAKEGIYAAYGVASIADMGVAQLRNAIGSLEGTVRRPLVSGRPDYSRPVNGFTKQLRSEVLKLITGAPAAHGGGLGLPNSWPEINRFVATHAGKAIPAMTDDELLAFKRKLFAIREKGWRYGDKEETCPEPPQLTATYMVVKTPNTVS